MDSPASTLFQEDAPQVDDTFAESMGFVTTYLRAVESARQDRLVNDPYAEPLTRKQHHEIKKFMSGLSNEMHPRPENFIALRTRYLDEALAQRDPRVLQVVILGAGLDARAFRLECLRGCHVLEVDKAGEMFDHKSEVMIELHAPLVAQKVDCIVLGLTEGGLEAGLMGRGFNPMVPTFWAMEGLIPYIERPGIVELLTVVDRLSAPGSELWADIPGKFVADPQEWGKRAMKYGEDDPVHGVLSEIRWAVKIQASLGTGADHFGRQWIPMRSPKTKQEVPFFFVAAKKPILTEPKVPKE
ncbi:putative S-adenosyl-L-methionine-dependent methyltransferase [Phytophthora ramorum]|uniref:O-methyltransferase domain-containing protein n=1 Tax=Phytophthora ramorum TaxID=164328 RepID=H3GXC7_PHYRM|nr:putative S-adenosyl-L-methionine-dependent methyltransferase [Phytophthora ramorum]